MHFTEEIETNNFIMKLFQILFKESAKRHMRDLEKEINK